jgi:hypothetical protein
MQQNSQKRDIPFPEPTMIAGRNYWYLGQIRKWRAAIAGQEPPEPQPDDEIMLPARQVRGLFGGASAMWLWRRVRRPGSAAALRAARPPPVSGNPSKERKDQ